MAEATDEDLRELIRLARHLKISIPLSEEILEELGLELPTVTFLASEITPKMKHRRTLRATPVSASVSASASASASVSASAIPDPEPLVAKSAVPQDLDEDESDGKGNSVLFTMSQVRFPLEERESNLVFVVSSAYVGLGNLANITLKELNLTHNFKHFLSYTPHTPTPLIVLSGLEQLDPVSSILPLFSEINLILKNLSSSFCVPGSSARRIEPLTSRVYYIRPARAPL